MNDTEEALNIIKDLEKNGKHTSWRMIYRRFSGDDFRLREALAELLGEGKIAYDEGKEVYASVKDVEGQQKHEKD